MKIAKEVSFNISNLWSNSVARQVNFNWTKIGEKFKCDILDDFQTT